MISSGITTDRRSFEEREFENTQVKCPDCGQRHVLTCEEAVFVDHADAGGHA